MRRAPEAPFSTNGSRVHSTIVPQLGPLVCMNRTIFILRTRTIPLQSHPI